MKRFNQSRIARMAIVGSMACAFAVFAQTATQNVPEEIEQVTFQQRLDSQVPLDLTFRDSTGKTVQLKDYLNGKPVILSLVYYECPMLCTLVLNGELNALKKLPFDAGKEFNAVTISFDHEETHVLAEKKKTAYLKKYNRKGAEQGWHFLVGDKEPIQQLADAVGFEFKYIAETDEYAHRSGIVVLTPDGKVSRYFAGIDYDPIGLRLGLVEASEGKIGGFVDKLFLLCYHYDPSVGKYGLLITRVVNIACGITAALVIFSVGMFLMAERRHRRQQELAKAGA